MATEQTVTATIKEEYARDGSLESTEATVAKTTTGADDDTIDLPSDPITVMLAALLLIAVLAVAYFAAPIVLPIVLALVLNLLFQPGMRALENVRLPRALAALILILIFFGAIVAIGAAVSGPATEWATKLPDGSPRLQERLKFLSQPVAT
jgi:predicted PurR-regulated permease PerM